VPPGVTAKLQFGDDLIDGGTANAVRLIVEPWHPGMEVNMNPRLGIDPEVLNWSDSNFWRRWRFSDRLAYLEIFVAAEVAVYEYDCTGESRKASVLSDSYRAECDARPQRPLPVPASPRATVWTDSSEGTPASEETLQGVGFPRGPAVPGTDHGLPQVAVGTPKHLPDDTRPCNSKLGWSTPKGFAGICACTAVYACVFPRSGACDFRPLVARVRASGVSRQRCRR
jgi:hypothetical protein